MLQAFREHKRWLMVIAMVFIIPSFVVTGIYSYNRMTQSDNSIVKVGEVSITPENFDLAKRQQLERLRQEMGESFHASLLDTPQAREDLLRMLMDEAAINQVVAKNHISVSEAQAVALIKNADALKVDGKFSAERYEQFLRSQGKSDQQFVMEIRNDLAKEAVVSGVSATYPVPKALTEQFYEILTEERSVRTLVLPADDYLDKVAVTDEEIKAYYNAHLKDFLSPEHIKAQYVVFSPDAFSNQKASLDDLKTFYEHNKQRWTVPEERRASHILIEFGDDKEAARKKAEELANEVKADPSKFAELAKANSVDTGSAEQGGDLSFFGRGVMTKAFEDAVFNAKKGDIVGPIETEFGWHVIYVTDIHPAAVEPFEDVKSEIEREYAQQQAIREFSTHADEFTNLVYEQSDTLEPAAAKFGLKVETADFVTRNGVTDPELSQIITEHVAESLFGTEALKEKRNTSAIEVSGNRLVSARVVEYFPEAERPLDEVKGLITDALKRQKAGAMAIEAGQAKLASVQQAKSVDGFGDEMWISRRAPQNQEVTVVNAALALPTAKLPSYTNAVLADGSYVVIYVKEAKKHEAKPEDLAGITRELSSVYGESDRRGYLDALEHSLGVEVQRPDFVKGEAKQTEE